jgi:hypothetical protein
VSARRRRREARGSTVWTLGEMPSTDGTDLQHCSIGCCHDLPTLATVPVSVQIVQAVCAAEAEQQHVSALVAIMQMLHEAIQRGVTCPACPSGHSCRSL